MVIFFFAVCFCVLSTQTTHAPIPLTFFSFLLFDYHTFLGSFSAWLPLSNIPTSPNLGPLTALGGVEGLGFIKTRYANYSDDYPDFEIHLITGGPSSDDGQTFRRVQGFSREMWEKVYKPYLAHDAFSLYPVLLRPKSRGFVKLRTTNPYDPPIIDPRYLTHPDDILAVVDAMKISIAVGFAPVFKKFGAQLFQHHFPGCEIYTLWSDEYLACVARTYTSTIYHPVGTCRMGSHSDRRSVVDPQFRVLGGIKGLRVVDGSVMPEIVSGNTNAPIIMMGERCADFIKGQRLPPAKHSPRLEKRIGHSSTTPAEDIESEVNDVTNADVPGLTNFKFVEDIMNNLVDAAKKRRRRRRRRSATMVMMTNQTQGKSLSWWEKDH